MLRKESAGACTDLTQLRLGTRDRNIPSSRILKSLILPEFLPYIWIARHSGTVRSKKGGEEWNGIIDTSRLIYKYMILLVI